MDTRLCRGSWLGIRFKVDIYTMIYKLVSHRSNSYHTEQECNRYLDDMARGNRMGYIQS